MKGNRWGWGISLPYQVQAAYPLQKNPWLWWQVFIDERINCKNCDIYLTASFSCLSCGQLFPRISCKEKVAFEYSGKTIVFKINGVSRLWIILQKPATRSVTCCNHWPGWSEVTAPTVAPPVFMPSAWRGRWPGIRYQPKNHSWFLSQTSHMALGKLSKGQSLFRQLLIISHLTIHPTVLYTKVVSWSWL